MPGKKIIPVAIAVLIIVGLFWRGIYLRQQKSPPAKPVTNSMGSVVDLKPQPNVPLLSPDMTMAAGFMLTSTGENRIEVANQIIITSTASIDFSSLDGEHGEVIDQLDWTDNSRFLIFNTHNSGGHQPWRKPTYIFDVGTSKFYRLDDFLTSGAVGGKFELVGDTITFPEWIYANQDYTTTTLNISQLLFTTKTPLPPNPDK